MDDIQVDKYNFTKIYGHISTPYYFRPYASDDGIHHVFEENYNILKMLPDLENEADLSRYFFNLVHPKNAIYSHEFIISFGATYQTIDLNWEEWLNKFESLLKKLSWIKIFLHLDIQKVGVYSYEWTISQELMTEKQMFSEDNRFYPTEEWVAFGKPRKFEFIHKEI